MPTQEHLHQERLYPMPPMVHYHLLFRSDFIVTGAGAGQLTSRVYRNNSNKFFSIKQFMCYIASRSTITINGTNFKWSYFGYYRRSSAGPVTHVSPTKLLFLIRQVLKQEKIRVVTADAFGTKVLLTLLCKIQHQ